MNLDDLIKLAGVAKSQADTPVQEQPVDETDGMRTLIALVTPEQLNQLQGDAPMAEEMPGEATTEPNPQEYEGRLGSPADLSLRRYLGANGDVVKMENVYPDHKVEEISEAWKDFKEGKGSKPDYIDIDGDGDKEESMKKAAKDKKAKADESVEETKVAEEPNEANKFIKAKIDAEEDGDDSFTVDGKKYKVTDSEDLVRLRQLAGAQQVQEEPNEAGPSYPGEYDYMDPKYMNLDGSSKVESGAVAKIMDKHPQDVAKMKATGDLDSGSDLMMDLMDYYSDEMPYGTMKARDGDPVEWIMNKLDDMDMLESKVAEQEAEVVEDENINMLKTLAGV